jgi:hypothetical protein
MENIQYCMLTHYFIICNKYLYIEAHEHIISDQ